MSSFKAKCILFNTDTQEGTEVTVKSSQDIIDMLGGSSVSQINIDKYHKVFYNPSIENFNNGVSGWVHLKEELDESNGVWVSTEGKDYFVGDKILIVLCDDTKPIDIDDTAKEFIISCISI